MQLTLDRSQLLRILSHAQGVVEKKTTLPVLSNIRLQTSADALTISATDLDLAYTETIPAQVTDMGTLTVPAHLLYDIVRKLPTKAELVLSTEQHASQIKVAAARSEFLLPTLPGDDFPDIQHTDMPYRFTLKAEELRFMIDHTRFAIALEETRYYLNGLYWHVDPKDPDHLRVVATDGHRLAKARIPLPEGAQGMPNVILSRKTISEIRKIIDSAEGDVRIALSDRQVQFQCGTAQLTSRLIDGVFPDYQRVIPHTHDRHVTVKTHDLAEAVERVAIITHERSRAIRFAFSEVGGVLTAHNVENGSAREGVVIQYKGEPIEIGFNARYISDILDQITGDEVSIELSDPSAPALIRDTADARVLYVVMPMRV